MNSELRPQIEYLIRSTDLSDHIPTILKIGEGFPTNKKDSYYNLIKIDRTIPGLGLHNVGERAADGLCTGIYNIADRPLFRGIQYVEMHLSSHPLEWLARSIVTESCYHVESCLKRRLGVDEPLSVGMILKKTRGQVLDSDLTETLGHLNRAIYNDAKHTIEDMDLDSHMFSIADSVAVYLACRVVGARLLTGMGITTRYGEPVVE